MNFGTALVAVAFLFCELALYLNGHSTMVFGKADAPIEAAQPAQEWVQPAVIQETSVIQTPCDNYLAGDKSPLSSKMQEMVLKADIVRIHQGELTCNFTAESIQKLEKLVREDQATRDAMVAADTPVDKAGQPFKDAVIANLLKPLIPE